MLHADGDHSVQPNGSDGGSRSGTRPVTRQSPRHSSAHSVTEWPTRTTPSSSCPSSFSSIDHVVDEELGKARACTASLGGLVTAPVTGSCDPPQGAWVGWAGQPDLRARPLRQRRHPHRPRAAQPSRPRKRPRGIQQRHARPLDHYVIAQLGITASGGTATTRSTSGSAYAATAIAGAACDCAGAGRPPAAAPGRRGWHAGSEPHRALFHTPFPAYGDRFASMPWRTTDHRRPLGVDAATDRACRRRRQLLPPRVPPARILDEEPVHRGAGHRDRRPPGG